MASDPPPSSDDEENLPPPSSSSSLPLPSTTTYTHTHRAFLQALLAHQVLTFATARPIVAAILTAANPARPTLAADVSEHDFHEYMRAIGAAVSPFDYEVRSMMAQGGGERIWALVNTTSDAVTGLGSAFSVDEMGFVRRVLDAIFEGGGAERGREVFAIRGMEALRLRRVPEEMEMETQEMQRTQMNGVGKMASLSNQEAERVLDKLVAQGWLRRSRKGWLSPTERMLMELDSWLRDMYDDDEEEDEDDDEEEERQSRKKIKDCMACKQIITVGHRCPTLVCDVRLHDHCVERFFRGRAQRLCPTCKTDWTHPLPVGEKAARNYDDGAGRRSTNGSNRRSTMNGQMEDDSDATAGAA